MKTPIALLSVLAVLTGAFACTGRAEPKPEAVAEEAVTARLAAVETVTVPLAIELPGTVEADRTAAVSSRVMATVTAVHVRAGDPVRRGQLLVEIDPQTASGQVAQARGGLAQAQAGLALAERNYQRFQALAATEAASQLELDLAKSQYEQAKGAVEQARGAVSSASSVAAESRVVAPFDGRVAARLVEAGDLAAPGRPLVQIESSSAHRLAVAVPESLLAKAGLALGSAVQIAIDARPDLGRFAGTVAELSPGADPVAHTFTVKIGLGKAEAPSGSTGRAWLSTGERSTVAVPTDAVLRQGGAILVVVRDAEGRAVSRIVTLGADLGDGRTEVLSGLTGGETVLAGLAAVPPLGAKVQTKVEEGR
jgi:RND family efflux transporter MFP subunit